MNFSKRHTFRIKVHYWKKVGCCLVYQDKQCLAYLRENKLTVDHSPLAQYALIHRDNLANYICIASQELTFATRDNFAIAEEMFYAYRERLKEESKNTIKEYLIRGGVTTPHVTAEYGDIIQVEDTYFVAVDAALQSKGFLKMRLSGDGCNFSVID